MNFKKTVSFLSYLFIIVFLYPSQIRAQSLGLGNSVIEDYYRRAQLIGSIDPAVSFVIRPLSSVALIDFDNIFDPEYTLKKNTFTGNFQIGKNKNIVKLLPINIRQQFNSHHPEGFNDGAMIPSRGYQNIVSMGIFVKYGSLSIQFQPEFVYAQNKAFEGFIAHYVNPLGLTYPFSPHSKIDFPEKFGDHNYSKFFWGQSSIRLTFGSISFGLSNENLWWGPGIYNSLLMTNTSPGFKHFTFNTVKPVKTPIGFFEWQVIAGRLDGSGYTNGVPDDWRYINAMVISYQPQWVPGLFVGLIRSFVIYKDNLGGGLGNYLPALNPFAKSSSEVDYYGSESWNQLSSIFMRWVWTKSHVEIYAEYGRKSNVWDVKNMAVQASHSNAYILGFKKLIPLNKYKEAYISINVELSQLESNPVPINNIRGDSWYEHCSVVHGYTHQGQILGAGIGPGSNLQTMNISWVKSLKSVGIQFDRFVHNNDFYFEFVKDIRENWVDISATAFATWDYKNLIFDVKLKFVKSFNYQWVYEAKLGDPSYFWEGKGWDVFNFQAQLGLTYRF